jgi:molybdopterin/thiamine biosynthesis adenylyltransferase
MNLDLKLFRRFEKQIILKRIGINGQKKIFKSKVLIIGVGGLGCPLITYLAASGVGTIGIVDKDKIELSNLNRQTLFVSKDIGKFKVIQAKNYIKKVNNKIKIKTFKQKVSLSNIKSIIKDFDIICDGTDNYETRYIINDQCKKSKKILISAAISKFSGHLFKFNFKKKGCCYRCFMPDKPEGEDNCNAEGIFSPVAGILGSLQANEVLKTILNFKNDLNNQMIIFDSIKSNFRNIKLTRNSNCRNRC